MSSFSDVPSSVDSIYRNPLGWLKRWPLKDANGSEITANLAHDTFAHLTQQDLSSEEAGVETHCAYTSKPCSHRLICRLTAT